MASTSIGSLWSSTGNGVVSSRPNVVHRLKRRKGDNYYTKAGTEEDIDIGTKHSFVVATTSGTWYSSHDVKDDYHGACGEQW